MIITAGTMHFQELNAMIRDSRDREVIIDKCFGQRYIGSGLSGKNITINGTPGNALGAYLNGATINVNGNAQDAIGDTMNEGEIVVNGSSGDATGYAMRGGSIFVKENAGYRAGIHMKSYKDKSPVIVIGGCAGSFLGEYQAGGKIIVLGIGNDGAPPVGYFCGTGMHGGKILLRCNTPPADLPAQVCVTEATKDALDEFVPYIDAYCDKFGVSSVGIYDSKFYILEPNSGNPYKRLYTQN